MNPERQRRSARTSKAAFLLALAAGLLLSLGQSTLAQKPAVASSATAPGKLSERLTLPAASLNGKELPFRILLPADYESGKVRYPVLYLLHGLTGNENDWWVNSKLIDYAAKYQLIIVTPGVGDSWYANSASDPAARYEDVIIKDLIPYIDQHYRTRATRDCRAIAGLSMGGLAAVKFALKYPDKFIYAASFSGALDVPRTARLFKSPSAKTLRDLHVIYGDENSVTRTENDPFQLLQRADPKRLPHFYLSFGKSDPLPQVTDANPLFADALRGKGITPEYFVPPGTHDWHFWDAQIEQTLSRMCSYLPRNVRALVGPQRG